MRMLVVLVGLALLVSACGVDCNAPYIQVGNDCCLDKDGDGVCDTDAAPKATPQPTPTPAAPVVKETEPTTTELDGRTFSEVQDRIDRTYQTYVPLQLNDISSLHYEATSYPVFKFYGSSNIDLLEVKDERLWFDDYEGAKKLIEDYAVVRNKADNERLAKESAKNIDFELRTDVNEITVGGGMALELRSRAMRIQAGTNDMGAPYSDPIEPWGVVAVYIPCPPNMIISFFGANDGVGKFAGNYEGEEYWHELDTSLDEISGRAQFKAAKIMKWCGQTS